MILETCHDLIEKLNSQDLAFVLILVAVAVFVKLYNRRSRRISFASYAPYFRWIKRVR